MSSMSPTPQSPARMITVVIVLLLGTMILLGSSFSAVSSISRAFTETFVGQADIITPRVPFTDSWAELDPKGFDPFYAGVKIQSQDPLPEARTLRAIESGLTGLVGILAGLSLVIIALGLVRGRGFSRIARWVVGTLGVIVMITALAAPQLDALAVDIAAQQLGYPTFNSYTDTMMTESSPELLVLALWDPLWTLNRVDFAAFALGAVIAFAGFLLRDGLLLQRALGAASTAPEPESTSPIQPDLG